jgi:hypothetical protein
MTIHPNFLTEINEVDATKTLVFRNALSGHPEAAGYTEFEFSYSDLGGGNYQVVGGSDFGCTSGAARLLWDLGFRFIGQTEEWIVRPASIATGLSRAKGTNAVKTPVQGLTDNFNWFGTYLADRTTQRNEYFHWRKVLGAEDSPWPHGHKWQDLINTAVAYFDAPGNEALTKLIFRENNGTYERTLALPEIVPATADWTKLTRIAASYLAPICAAHVNFAAAFDPLDGSPTSLTTDVVLTFTEAVVALIRAGVPEITGYYPARAAVPLAKLGILAYADHSEPPTAALTAGIYVQITSNYLFWTPPGLTRLATWAETIAGWAPKSPNNPLTTYVYPDLNLYHHGQPMVNKHCRSNGWDIFDLTSLDGFFTEYGPACLPNAAQMNWLIMRTFIAGVTYEDALADLVAKRFNGDPAVTALYRLWGRDYVQYTYDQVSLYDIKKSFDHVYDMVDGEYKTIFKQYLVFVSRFQRMPASTPVSAEYQAALDQICSNVMATRRNGMIHAYSWMYRDGGVTPLSDGYVVWIRKVSPGIYNESLTPPAWYLSPVAPNDADFDAEYALLEVTAARDDNLEDDGDPDNYVLMTGLDLVATGTNPIKNHQRIIGPTRIAVVGPCTLSLAAQADGLEEPETIYPAGIHLISVSDPPGYTADYVATLNGGALFVDGSTAPIRNGGVGRSYLFVQPGAEGIVDMDTSGSSNFYAQSGQYILYNNKGDPNRQAPANLGPGVIAHDDSTSSVGRVLAGNINPWFSNDPEMTLITKALAQSEYRGLMKVTLA